MSKRSWAKGLDRSPGIGHCCSTGGDPMQRTDQPGRDQPGLISAQEMRLLADLHQMSGGSKPFCS
jgi:hypothetical protein